MKTDSESENAAFEEGFNSVRHSIPPENELKGMPYTQLAVLLAGHAEGSPAHSVISREMESKARAEDTKAQRIKVSFWQHPVIKTVLYIIGVVVAAAVVYVLGLKEHPPSETQSHEPKPAGQVHEQRP